MVRLIAVSKWFQICGAAEEKPQLAKSVFILGTYKRDWLEEQSNRLDWLYIEGDGTCCGNTAK